MEQTMQHHRLNVRGTNLTFKIEPDHAMRRAIFAGETYLGWVQYRPQPAAPAQWAWYAQHAIEPETFEEAAQRLHGRAVREGKVVR